MLEPARNIGNYMVQRLVYKQIFTSQLTMYLAHSCFTPVFLDLVQFKLYYAGTTDEGTCFTCLYKIDT